MDWSWWPNHTADKITWISHYGVSWRMVSMATTVVHGTYVLRQEYIHSICEIQGGYKLCERFHEIISKSVIATYKINRTIVKSNSKSLFVRFRNGVSSVFVWLLVYNKFM
jgi:hypothetical protein